MSYCYSFMMLLITFSLSVKADAQLDDKKINQFISNAFNQYPESQLTDIYKNLFQEAFGPGHLIPDTTRAGVYLDSELKSEEWVDTIPFHPLGLNHDYYRVNLLLVKNGIIPREVLLQGMVASASLARNPDIETWKKEWNKVVLLIKARKPDLPNLASDEKMIAETLSSGNVVMHHSRHFEETYHPHYRIIHKSIVEEWLKTYIDSK